MAAGFLVAVLAFVLHVIFQQGAGGKGVGVEVGRVGVHGQARLGAGFAAHAAEEVGDFEQFFGKSNAAAGGLQGQVDFGGVHKEG